MPKGRRLYDLALRGCLIAAFAVFAGVGLAQDAEQPVAEAPETKPIEEPVRVENETQNPETQQQPKDTDKPPTQPIPPIAPFDNARQAEPACGERCRVAEQREKDDLIAQQQMANATKRMVTVGWWQFGLGCLGLLLLAITAWYAYRAAVAAENAVKEAKKTTRIAAETNVFFHESSQKELRAYLSLSPGGVGFAFPGDGRLIVFAAHKNNGQTPAKNARLFIQAEKLPYPLPKEFRFPSESFLPGVNVIHPGDSFTVSLNVDISPHDVIWGDGTSRIYVFAYLFYVDVFKKERHTRACWSYDCGALHSVAEKFEQAANDPQRREPLKPIAVEFEYTERYNSAT